MAPMSPEARPAATPFQPGSGVLPPALEPAIMESTSPILLMVASDVDEAVARAAIGLAEARGREAPTILADASMQEPRLDEILDVDNLEGLADVFLFGASLDRVRIQPADRSFDFVPVGPYVPDPSAVLESSRWLGIANALRTEGARLFLFVPADSPGLGILSRRVGEAVLLGDARSVERSASKLDPSCEVLAVVELTSELAPGPSRGDAGAEPDLEAATIFDEPELPEPVVFRSDRESRRVLSPILLLLLLAALAAAAWFAYQEYFPRSTPRSAAQAAPVAAVEEEVERGEPIETPIPVSVAVEAHQDLDSARERAAVLRGAEPDINFYLAPVSVRDVLYYRLLAGPVTDREAGERLMERLVEAEYKTAADPWAIRPTEYAFQLGEYTSEADAQDRVDSLTALDVPSYIVPIRYDRGPNGYRVYGGAYESEAEAAVMGDLLLEAGIDGRLVVRTGEPVPEGP